MSLYEAAKAVVDSWESGDLAAAVNALAAALPNTDDPDRKRLMELAREMRCDDEFEVDDDALISYCANWREGESTAAAWVQGWIYVEWDVCSKCGKPHEDGDDGYDDLCGNCADAEENKEAEEAEEGEGDA